ncbi:MAG TPA: sulfite exporter TauE/SafE family protein [Candidatus Saccharimonadales bacterium]|nr:sulfite exporter TauE/SafE family protein [Candidatus Saccharimonadales bacterium]
MNVFEFSIILGLASLLAGFLGALTGLGGGVVIVPLLALGFGVDIHYAIGASLVSVIATSSGSAAAYVREGFCNIRIGMFLEIATTIGAIFGAFLAAGTPTKAIAIIFGLMLLGSAVTSSLSRKDRSTNRPPDSLASTLRLNGSYPADGIKTSYTARRIPLGFGLMFGAGTLSGLLGIGSGAVKVLAMDEAMQLPFKVSTTTSNFMIGVTAAASAGVYLSRGYIDPAIAMPVTLGVLAGAMAGARFLVRARVRVMRLVFAAVIALLGFEMIYNGLTGRL